MALLILADGHYDVIKPKNGKFFSLEELQEFVGGMIEYIGPHRLVRATLGSGLLRVTNQTLMVINEEGKLNNLPVNELATSLYRNGHIDPIVGDVVVLTGKERR